MSTLRVNQIENVSGVGRYTAAAWVNFNGTGTVAIRASGNVSSITDNGVGNYTVNFATAMPDANYGVSGTSCSNNVNANGFLLPGNQAVGGKTASSCNAISYSTASAVYDAPEITFIAFR